MLTFDCITSGPWTWDIIDSDGRIYRWGGDLGGALREAKRLEKLANE